MLLLVDHLALRARSYEYLVRLFEEWEVGMSGWRGPWRGSRETPVHLAWVTGARRSHLGYERDRQGITGLVHKSHQFHLMPQSTKDAGGAELSQESHKELHLSEEVKALN